MTQMIISTKQKQIIAKESRLVVARGEERGVKWLGVWGWWMQTLIFGMNGKKSYCTAQGTVYDWVTLLYNGNWRNMVNQLYCKKRERKITLQNIQRKNTKILNVFFWEEIGILTVVRKNTSPLLSFLKDWASPPCALPCS